MAGKTDEQNRVASRNERQTVITGVACEKEKSAKRMRQFRFVHTNGIHRVGSQFENAVEYQCTTLEEDVAPVPAIVLHNVMRLGLDP